MGRHAISVSCRRVVIGASMRVTGGVGWVLLIYNSDMGHDATMDHLEICAHEVSK